MRLAARLVAGSVSDRQRSSAVRQRFVSTDANTQTCPMTTTRPWSAGSSAGTTGPPTRSGNGQRPTTPRSFSSPPLLTDAPDDLLKRATKSAETARDRQLVVIAAAYVAGQHDRLDTLVRDHLADHPGNILAAWIAAQPARRVNPPRSQPGPPIGAAMTDPTTTTAPIATTTSWPRTVGRWMVSSGFPIGGYAAFLLVGPVDSLIPSLVGGLLTGAVLGALQAWAFGRARPSTGRWIIATALGLMVGLGVGAAVVGYQTTLSALLLQGAMTVSLSAPPRRWCSPQARPGRTGLACRSDRHLGRRLGGHIRIRHPGRRPVHHLRLQRRVGRHCPDRRPPAHPHHHEGEQVMTRHVVFGTGQVGRLIVEQLVHDGAQVVAVNRTGQARLPGAQVVAGDATDPPSRPR